MIDSVNLVTVAEITELGWPDWDKPKKLHVQNFGAAAGGLVELVLPSGQRVAAVGAELIAAVQNALNVGGR